jgi:hypothetical protein
MIASYKCSSILYVNMIPPLSKGNTTVMQYSEKYLAIIIQHNIYFSKKAGDK